MTIATYLKCGCLYYDEGNYAWIELCEYHKAMYNQAKTDPVKIINEILEEETE